MRSHLTILFLWFTTVGIALAQSPPEHLIVAPETPLQQAIDQQLQVYADGGRPEVLRTSNALIYPHGVYQPVLTCTVLRICIIELEPGEEILSMGAGDHVRWSLDHGRTGPGGRTIYVTVVPTDYDLTTNLVISTNVRMYHMTLDSPPRKHGAKATLNPLAPYTRHVKFYYPAKYHVLNQPVDNEEDDPAMKIETTLDKVNYGYAWRTENDFPWEPLAVFDDGSRVYLRIPDHVEPTGAVLILGEEGEAQPGTYILRGDVLIIERLFDEARLIVPGPPKRKGLFGKKRQSQRILVITSNL